VHAIGIDPAVNHLNPALLIAVMTFAGCKGSDGASASASKPPEPPPGATTPAAAAPPATHEVVVHGFHAAVVAKIPPGFRPDGSGFTNGPIYVGIDESPGETPADFKYAHQSAKWSRDTTDNAGWILVGEENGAPVIAVWRKDVKGLCFVSGATRDQVDAMIAVCSSLRITGGPPDVTAEDDRRMEETDERVAEQRLNADSACPSGDRHRCDDVSALLRQLTGRQPADVIGDEIRISSCKKRRMSRKEAVAWFEKMPILFPKQVACKSGCCAFTLGDNDAPGDAGVIASKACFASGRLVELVTSCGDRS
jgi:hypothetical protein